MRHPLALFTVVFLLLASAASNAAPELPTGPASGAWLNGSLDLLEDPDGNLAVEDLEQAEQAGRFVAAAGRTSVPQIFIGETHVGGCDDLYALEEAGRLDALAA